MKSLYLFTIFDSDGGRPRCTGIQIGDKVQVYDLYRPGSRTPIKIVNDNKKLISGLVLKASAKGIPVVVSDFKNHVRAFDLPRDLRTYNVYDLALPDVKPSESLAKDTDLLRTILSKMAKQTPREWQKVYANAAVVYQDLEDRGLWNNYVVEKPVWSQKVFSGRSKSLGFNIQGFIEPHFVVPPGTAPTDLLLHFDWISADIRAAAIISGDPALDDAFQDSDPYTFMMKEINSQSDKRLSRDECKLLLLQAVNSMDFTSVALTKIYPKLGDWITECKKITSQDGGYLETILGRKFKVAHAKNDLAVLNGVMQGSVAHAMQNVVRKVWERFPHRLVMEGHDSMVVTAPKDGAEVTAIARAVGEIMLHPFEGILSSNPAFPLKVSVGKKWRKWKLWVVIRPGRFEYVKSRPEEERVEPPPAQEEDGEGEGPGGQEGGVEESQSGGVVEG